jgi:type I restriction enzyme S subunit
MNEWRDFSLGELVRFRNGKSTKGVAVGNYPIYGSNGIIGGAAAFMYENAIILGRVGAYCGSVEYTPCKFWATDNTIVVEPIQERLDVRFAASMLRHANLNRYAGGAAQPLLTQTNIRGLQFTVPKIETQRRIASIIGAYDDLIQVNRRRVAVLEEMARGLFEEWFVRFRFPGHEVVPILDTPDGPLPQGWQHLPLQEVAEIAYGFPFKSNLFSTTQEGVRVIRIRDVPDGSTSTWSTEGFDQKYAVRDGDILIGMDGIFHMAMWAGGDAALNQRVTRLRPSRGHSKRWVFLSVYPQVKYFEATISGTTVAHLGAKHLNSMRVPVAPNGIQQIADRNFKAIDEILLSIRLANVRLAASRDLLLPRLISGQLSVASVERELEEVE